MSATGHRPLDEILDDLDWVTTIISGLVSSGEDLGSWPDVQEGYIREMNDHPDKLLTSSERK